jgi:hypothetical protein
MPKPMQDGDQLVTACECEVDFSLMDEKLSQPRAASELYVFVHLSAN